MDLAERISWFSPNYINWKSQLKQIGFDPKRSSQHLAIKAL